MSALKARGDITLYQQEWYRGMFRLLARAKRRFLLSFYNQMGVILKRKRE